MKRRLTIFSVLLVLLVFSMPNAFASDYGKLVLYDNETYKFQMGYPDGWMAKEGFMGSVAAFISTAESASEFHPNVNVVVQDLSNYPNLTLENSGAASIAQLEKLITDFKLVSNGKCSLSSNPALVYIFDGRQGAHNLRWLQVYTFYNNKAYIVTFTAGHSDFYRYEGLAAEIINSFKIY